MLDEEEEDYDSCRDSKRSVAWELIPFSGALRLHAIDLEYDHMSAGWPAPLTASAFNRLCQYAGSPGKSAYCYAKLAVSRRS